MHHVLFCLFKVLEYACNEGDLGSIPGSGRPPGEGHSNPLSIHAWEIPWERGAWWVGYSPWGHKELNMTE